jgi:putative tryptophan/tyrosine transport system substrate-binding protein
MRSYWTPEQSGTRRPTHVSSGLTRVSHWVALVVLMLAASPIVEAQSPSRIPRIGYLVLSPLVNPPSSERQAFLDGLSELGYVVGRNLAIEYRSANWNRELLDDLAEELVALKVDVIVAVPGTQEAVRRATRTVPIIIPGMESPVENGLVASLARPGRNITGTAWGSREIAGKRVQLLKEVVPRISTIAVLWNPGNVGEPGGWDETQASAKRLGLTLDSYAVRDPKDFPNVLAAMARKRPDALITFVSALTTAYRPIIVEFANKQRLPTMFATRADVEGGGLVAYAAHIGDLFRRTASYVDRVLKGARPGDLPIEEPTRFELAVNLNTARALGITIPSTVLIRADTVVE